MQAKRGGEDAGPTDGVELRLLGQPAVRTSPDDQWIALRMRESALLTLLARRRSMARADIVDLLWPAKMSDKRNSLSNLLGQLKRHTGVALCTGGDTLALAATVRHDLRQPGEGSRGSAAGVAGILAGIDFRQMPAFLRWLDKERAAWHAQWLEERRKTGERCEQLDDWSGALQAAADLLEQDPLDEIGHHLRIRVHLRSGNPDDATRARKAFEAALKSRRRELSAATLGLFAAVDTGLPIGSPPAMPLSEADAIPTRLVGRGPEMKAIEGAWRQRRHCVVEGAEGLGMSRLTLELARGGRAVLWRCHPSSCASPFAAARGLLDALHKRGRPLAPPWAVAQLAPLHRKGRASAPARRIHLVDLVRALRAVLQSCAGQGLEALVFDDFHLCDPASQALILQALEDEPPLSLVLACKPGSAESDVNPGLPLNGCWDRVTLTPLTRTDVMDLLRATRLNVALLDEWADALGGLSLGHPSHLVQLLLQLRQNAGGARIFQGPPPDFSRMPIDHASLRALQQASLDRLPRLALQLARLVALAGGPMLSLIGAAKLLESTPAEVTSLWVDLERAQIVNGDALTHASLRDLLLEPLPLPVRRQWHHAIAEHAAQDRGATAADVAGHWWEAEDYAQSATQYAAAAFEAAHSGAAVAALHLWERAAESHRRAGDLTSAFAAAAEACREALAALPPAGALAMAERLLEQAGDDQQALAAVLLQAHGYWLAHAVDGLVQIGDRAQTLLQALSAAPSAAKGPSPEQRVDVAWVRSLGLAYTHREETASDLLESTRELLEEVGRRSSVAWHHALFTAQMRLGQVDAGIATGERALALAREHKDPALIQRQLVELSVAVSRTGDFQQALVIAREAVRLTPKETDLGMISLAARLGVAGFCWRLGRYQEAVEGMSWAVSHFRRGGNATWASYCESHLAMIYIDLGQLKLAQECMLMAPEGDVGEHHFMRAMAHAHFRFAKGSADLETAQEILDLLKYTRQESALAGELLAARLRLPEEAVGVADRIITRAVADGMRAMAQLARVVRVEALHAAGRSEEVVEPALALLDTLTCCQPITIYPPQAWCTVAKALECAGHAGAAAQAVALGLDWINNAMKAMPPQWHDAFQKHNLCNVELQKLAQGRRA